MRVIVTVLVWLAVYSLFLLACIHIDRNECERRGYEYGYTTVALDGYCIVEGERVPVWELVDK